VRVIAGSARGRTLVAPRGPATRPTSDLVRGVIFSMLAARGAALDRVLDLFSGSGALAIEALSRGADEAVLIDRDRAACAIATANLEKTGFADRARVICAALPGALARLPEEEFDVIFLDPPYDLAGIDDLLALIGGSRLVSPETTIVYEHRRRTMPPASCGPLARDVTRVHGQTAVSIYDESGNDRRLE
jgi:16S rRNA (guanine966-N2)-methyltransferase